MEKKLRQVTDNVHGTIYLSDFESKMMSTPVFYRLHDIYQSSTVYMTFPANRTKRYEHCLGTMHLAGEMFFSSIANADKDTRSSFMTALATVFSTITDSFATRTHEPFYWNSFDDPESTGSHCFSKAVFRKKSNTKEMIADAMRSDIIADPALEHQRVCFFNLLENTDKEGKIDADDMLVYAFLYQCVLEAVRIVALFHDVGHPPYSHILEETLNELYDSCADAAKSAPYCTAKAGVVTEMLGPFKGTYSPPQLLLRPPKGTNAPLHEQIGLKMLQTAFSNVLFHLYRDTAELNVKSKYKTARLLYYVTVVEFSFAILLEQAPVFSALHRMVDGPIDSDRLDYIVRDSANAGIDWGAIPYRRIINSARLVVISPDQFSVAFPEKISDDLEDILVTRYKVFSRINFHHRSTKTSRLLQKAVFLLADDYLRTPEDQECICPDICYLWSSLGGALGKTEEENRIAQWNDSWLISTLHGAFIKLSDPGIREQLEEENPERNTLLIHNLLEEILVNRKHYYSLLKRQKNAKKLLKGILKEADITDARLVEILVHEYSKLFDSTGKEAQEAQESLYRITALIDHIILETNFEDLEIYFPFGQCNQYIDSVLAQARDNGLIQDYIISPNTTRAKLGITNQIKDRIYLFAPDATHYPYDANETLIPLLLAQRATSLWLNVYVAPVGHKNSKALIDQLNKDIQKAIGKALGDKFAELFPPHKDTGDAGKPA